MEWYIWIIAGLGLCVLEIFTPGFFILLPGVAAILTGILALFVPHLAIQIGFFIVVSVGLIFLLRPLILGTRNKTSTAESNSDGMVGKVVPVVKEIPSNGKGYVKYYSDQLPARSIHKETISEGANVIIRKVDGITVFVEKTQG